MVSHNRVYKDGDKTPYDGNHELPSHIGFGVLDASKTRIEHSEGNSGGTILKASYVTRQGETVYQARLGKESCWVEELCDGEVIQQTKSPTLEEAFTQNFACLERNPRFRKMIDRMTRGKNVELVRPRRDGFRVMYFPAGLILVLRLPVVPYNRITDIDAKLRDLPIRVFIEGIYEGDVITASQGRLTHHAARFVDFSATLLDLEESVDLIFERGLVSQRPEMGLHILDPADAAPGSFQVFLVEQGTQREAYALLLKRPGDIDLVKADQFVMSSIGQMKRTENGQPTLLN